MTFYFTLEEALRIVERERIGPIADAGLLDAALARSAASAFGEDAYPTLELKAAALLQSLVKNHPLVDGNKRLEWLLTEMFVELNDAACDSTTSRCSRSSWTWRPGPLPPSLTSPSCSLSVSPESQGSGTTAHQICMGQPDVEGRSNRAHFGRRRRRPPGHDLRAARPVEADRRLSVPLTSTDAVDHAFRWNHDQRGSDGMVSPAPGRRRTGWRVRAGAPGWESGAR